MAGILWTIAAILLIVWVAGLVLHFLGAFIHILLVLAIIVILYNVFVGNRARTV
jgi:hypothetical protein